MKKLYTLVTCAALGAASLAAATHTGNGLWLKPKQARHSFAEHKMHKVAKAEATDSAAYTWKSVGTGTWRDDVLTSVGKWVDSWSVELEECEQIPGYYRAVNPYGNGNGMLFMFKQFDCGDIYFHTEDPAGVYCDKTILNGISLSYEDENGQPFSSRLAFYDYAGYLVADYGMAPSDLAAMGIPFGRFADGHITFEPGMLGLEAIDANDAIAANTSGLFRLSFPGAKDFEVSFQSANVCSSTPSFTASCTLGADAVGIKAVAKPGRPGMDELNSALEEVAATTGNEFTVQLEWGVNTLIIASVKPDGSLGERTTAVLYGQWDDNENWKDLGNATYGDAFIRDAYTGFGCDNYLVPIQEHKSQPGLYRLVNPYSTAWPNYNKFASDEMTTVCNDGHKHYLVIDATKPERVMIPASPTGLDAGSGAVQVYSACWDYINNEGMDAEDPQIVPDYGTLADGKITFPGGALIIDEPFYGRSRGNLEHTFLVQLPDETGVGSLVSNSATAEYFLLNGSKVSAPTAPGIYIRRTGTKVEKVIR